MTAETHHSSRPGSAATGEWSHLANPSLPALTSQCLTCAYHSLSAGGHSRYTREVVPAESQQERCQDQMKECRQPAGEPPGIPKQRQPESKPEHHDTEVHGADADAGPAHHTPRPDGVPAHAPRNRHHRRQNHHLRHQEPRIGDGTAVPTIERWQPRMFNPQGERLRRNAAREEAGGRPENGGKPPRTEALTRWLCVRDVAQRRNPRRIATSGRRGFSTRRQ